MSTAGRILLISGIMAAGKSTIAQALAERLPQSVHLRGDLFRRIVVSGQEAITADNWPAAEPQIHLRLDIASGVTRAYADYGYTVCYQDVIVGADLPRVIEPLHSNRYSVHVIILAPTPDVVRQHDRGRGKTGYQDWTPEEFDRSLRENTPQVGLWLDTSHLSVDLTVDAILDRQADARV